MQKIFLMLASLAVFFGFSLIAAAQDKTVDKRDVKKLEAIYKEFDAATKKRDLKTFEKYLDEKFEVEKDGRKLPRGMIFEVLKELFDAGEEISEVITKIEKIQVIGDRYYLETSTVLKGKFKLPEMENKISNVEIHTKSTDSWIKTPKGWKQILQIMGDSKILVDGEPVIFN